MKPERSLERAALSCIERHKMLEGGERVVVAVSGGPDSVALLLFLNGLMEELRLDLHVFHLDHMLRGAESAADAGFVKSLAERFSLPVKVLAVDVRSQKDFKERSPEEAAREVRMARIDEFAQEVEADRVALGHTADDQVETFLMRIIQGAGLTGMSGIPYVSGPLVRPLLDVWRSEVEEYCQRMGVEPRLDSSNLDKSYLRNRVRWDLVPFLTSEFGPSVKEVMLREVESLALDRKLLADEVLKAFDSLSSCSSSEVMLEIPRLESLHPSLQRGVLREAWERITPHQQSLKWQHLIDIRDKVIRGRSGSRLDLPGSVAVEREYEHLVFRLVPPSVSGADAELTLEVPGCVEVPGAGAVIEARRVSRDEVEFSDDPNVEFVNADIDLPLKVRTPRRGDRFTPLGSPGTRKLKDFFIDIKLPRAARRLCPLVLSQERIVWVAGRRIDERFKLAGEEDEAVMLIMRTSDAYDSHVASP